VRKIAKLFSIIILSAVFVCTIVFIHLNSTPVSISFGVLKIVDYPVSVWIIGAFAFGGLVGLILGCNWFQSIKSRMEIKNLTKKLMHANQMLKNHRSASFL